MSIKKNAGDWETIDVAGSASADTLADNAQNSAEEEEDNNNEASNEAEEVFSGFESQFETNSTDSNEDDTVEENTEDTENKLGASGEDAKKTAEAEEADKKKQFTAKQIRNQNRFEKLISLLKSKDDEIARERLQAAKDKQEREDELASYKEALANTYLDSSDQKIKAAEAKLRKAKQDLDIDSELEATRELQEAIVQKRTADDFKNQLPKERNSVAPDHKQFVTSQKTKAWMLSNRDLVDNPDIAPVIGKIAQQVQKEGYEPHEDEYYEEVTKRLNGRFETTNTRLKAFLPYDLYSADDTSELQSEPEVTKEAPVKESPVMDTKPKINPMAAAPRMVGKKKATLEGKASAEDVAYAKRMGVDPKSFLLNSMLEDKKNKFGYSPVYIPQKKKK